MVSQFESPYKSAGTGPGAPAGSKPENHLIYAILTTLCCCLPFGIVSIVYAAQVDSKWNSGDHAGAVEASANAKKWAMIALVSGILAYVIFAILYALAVAGIVAGGMNVENL